MCQMLFNYHDDFVTPGRSPLFANSRKQILHNLKSLIYALFLPHLQHRLTTLVENFGFLFDFTTCAVVAIYYFENGIPKYLNNNNPLS
ncbi:MAG: hypothetical protein US74_C0009G0017 [Parcubacteria group bacterium GW2011_GWA2_38_13]|nr:MAG: hypothetical protein US74_C0009G0017 [Parcubacteria group bacterium GW2011_GWA2_38_13]